MSNQQALQAQDLMLAHQIATAEFTKLNQLCQGQSLETISEYFQGDCIEEARYQAAEALEEIEEKLDCWFAGLTH
jgi:hypothetical protein